MDDKKKEKLSKMLIEKHKDIYEKLEDEPTLSWSVRKSLKEQLKYALIEISYGQVSEDEAEEIAEKSIDKFDFSNSALNHKGMNWYAKAILNVMGINTYKVADKETARKAMEDCTKKYNNALKNLADK
jgi:hypothetical protein